MTIPTRLVGFLTVSAAALSLGCDLGDPTDEPLLGTDLEFRDFVDPNQDPTGTKLNTNFLGEDEQLPLTNMSMTPGGEPGMEIVEIKAKECTAGGGLVLLGEFSTLPVSPDVSLGLAANGALAPLTVADVANPAVQCQIIGEQWTGTQWEIVLDVGEDPVVQVHTDLIIEDVDIDWHSIAIYEFVVNRDRVEGATGGRRYEPTCDEAQALPGFQYHAYLIKDLQVDLDTGEFSYEAPGNTMAVACLSASPGEAQLWYPDIVFGRELHETTSYLIRAAYEGAGDVTHTNVGEGIYLFDVHGQWDDPPPAVWSLEAAWSATERRALCLSTPRAPALSGNVSLPECTPAHVAAADILTYVQ